MTDPVVRGLLIDLELPFRVEQRVREPVGASADLDSHPGRHDRERPQRSVLNHRVQFTVVGSPACRAGTR
jgi:hypothetical protein